MKRQGEHTSTNFRFPLRGIGPTTWVPVVAEIMLYPLGHNNVCGTLSNTLGNPNACLLGLGMLVCS